MIDTIFVPRGAEERAVRRGLTRAGATRRVVATGIGAYAARRAADAALAEGEIAAALVTGLCGALSPAFAVGEPLVYAAIATDAAPLLLSRDLAAHVAARIPGAQSGIRAVDASDVVVAARDKARLAARYAAQAVDMESRAIVERLGVARVCVARVASDAAGDDLPDLHRALDGSGGIDGFALALAMVRRPLAGLRLARDGTRALAALERAIFALASADDDVRRSRASRVSSVRAASAP